MDDSAITLPQHKLCLELRHDELKGRGVFATIPIKRRTLIDVSPVLLFPQDEYATHGRYTQLDHYTYKWKDGYMALALGLGSMFNHNKDPNVGFIRDFTNQLIRYVALRDIGQDEELCISYGDHLWFEDATNSKEEVSDSEDDMAWMHTVMDG
ncbi:uncharacterized protein BX664DRAFT_336652 [Halteromyces radiatus]|uniref:uncharacterized protein n=1 Tax=Halteromyces radiatus TaxID=101107 RepID=UPI00221F86C3|nr:uncharacterized protein BX664DRAFT_336652 [Halteromyces radiatus]KAI8086743.1 hypothetical protein BX664DRAFT_336652 [Halteromyces radiatus]